MHKSESIVQGKPCPMTISTARRSIDSLKMRPVMTVHTNALIAEPPPAASFTMAAVNGSF